MIKNSILRCGNFTSSEIGKLMTLATDGKSWGDAALTYIEETNFERKLGRSISDEVSAKPLSWGSLLESRVFNLLGLEYTYTSKETIVHPEIEYWAGSKDGLKLGEGKTVWDAKCPITLKSFCQLVDPLYNGLDGMEAMNAIRKGYKDKKGIKHKKHKEGDIYYWQIVSGAILDKCEYGELIVYMPYQSELEEIKAMTFDLPGEDLQKYYWITMAGEDELPYLIDGGYYRNLNILRFVVPEEDKRFLTSKVLEASKLLIEI